MKRVLQTLVVILVLLGGAGARADAPAPDNATCLTCHGQPDFSITLPSGQTRSLSVSPSHFADSVHGLFQCTMCHTEMTQIPHTAALLPEPEWRQQAPRICGICHTEELKNYLVSTHGQKVMSGANIYAAVCTDCHTNHAVAPPTASTTRPAITAACAGCHARRASYEATYHGQIFALGYTNVATCADCHRGHLILPASDPASSVATTNRLTTCGKCHRDATAGFATFEPHPSTTNFRRQPAIYITNEFMWWLIVLTLGFFWAHSALWLFAEIRDRLQGRLRLHVLESALPQTREPRFRRYGAGWRWVHVIFAVSLMVLTLTGIPLIYPHSAWAPVVVHMLGGETIRSWIHRVSAVVFVGIFLVHIVYIAGYLVRNWKTVRLFGPYSLLLTLQDFRDFAAMMKWFAGIGRYPRFDHWNYQQKFDYWAPFWGVAIIGVSGAMIWFKFPVLAVLPGYVLDMALIAHGHEAVLAAGYLFTIHFFVNHWRPAKFPLDTVIFTGSMPLDEFKREFGAEYDRLVRTGELDKHLVEAPSRPMAVGSMVLGFTLILVGLVLLVMIFNGGFLNME